MKKNTNKPTFAQRAKSIMKKYPRAKFDSVEKEAMEQELDALIAEQEAMKQAMGVGAPEQQMELDTQQAMLEGSMEEPQMFEWGGNFRDPYKNLGYKPVITPFASDIAGAILQMQGANKISPNFEATVYGQNLSQNKGNSITTNPVNTDKSQFSLWNTIPTITPTEKNTANNTNSSIFPAGYPKAQPSFLIQSPYKGWNGGVNYPTTSEVSVTQSPTTAQANTSTTKTSGTKPKASSKTTAPSTSNPVVIPTPEEVAAMVPTQTTKPYSFDMSGLRFNPEAEEDLSGLNLTPKKFYSPTKSGWDKLKENEFLPSYVAAGAGILGNLGQMLMDKKPKDINFARYSPEEVDLSAQRLAAEREADLGRAVGRTTARNLGMGAGQAMSNIVSSESGVSRNLADALMKSRLAEETANVDARNKAGQFNAELGMKEQLMNTQQQEAWKERQREYLAGAVNVIPETMQDINKIKAQKEYLKQMGMSEENIAKWISMKYPNYSLDMDGKLATGTIFKNKQRR